MEKRVSKFIENAKKSTPATDKRSTTGLQGRKRKKHQNVRTNADWTPMGSFINDTAFDTDDITDDITDTSSDDSDTLLLTNKRTRKGRKLLGSVSDCKGQQSLGGVSNYLSSLKDDDHLIKRAESSIDDGVNDGSITPSLIDSDTPSLINSDTPSPINSDTPTLIESCSRVNEMSHMTGHMTVLQNNKNEDDCSETCTTSIDTCSEKDWESPVKPVKQSVCELSRTSKWIKQLVSTSPSAQHKAEDSNTSTAWRMVFCNSSSKKKSRRRSLRPSYINGGLADRMQRMLERQKSNLSFWSYSKRNDNVESGNSVTVLINSAINIQSLLCTEATLLSKNDNSLSESNEGDSIFVYFTTECAEQLPINTESIVRITSPWQSVLLQNGDSNNLYGRQDKLVIFSTQYCSLITGSCIGNEQDCINIEQGCINNEQGCINNGPFKERSPWKQDIHGNNNDGSSVPMTNAITQHKLINPVSVSKRKLFDWDHKDVVSSMKSRGSLVDVFDVERYDALSVVVTVRAIYCSVGINGPRWILLMEDNCRLFMELVIHKEHELIWKDIINNGLDNRYELYNIQFIKRIAKHQRPSLFQLIEKISIQINYSDVSVHCGSNYCCFILKTQDCSYWDRVSPSINMRMSQSCVQVYERVDHVRVTCPAKILFVSSDLEYYNDSTAIETIKEDNLFIYAIVLTNAVLNSPSLVKICLLKGFIVMDTILPGNIVSITNGLLVQNPLSQKEKVRDQSKGSVYFYLDSYSLIIPHVKTLPTSSDVIYPTVSIDQSDITRLNTYDFSQLPSLSDQTMVADDIVTIEGIITGVDETNAFVWLACDDCGSCLETFSMTIQKSHVCGKCDKVIMGPNVCVQLSVVICDSKQPANWKLSVELSQPTAHEVLPISIDCVSKGLDVSYLINKFISLDICIIIDIQKEEDDSLSVHLKEVNTQMG